ncbi:MAG: TolC family protein, partial [Candidatus Eisenbacteria bacterium]
MLAFDRPLTVPRSGHGGSHPLFIAALLLAALSPGNAHAEDAATKPTWEVSPDSMLAAALRQIEGAPLTLDDAMKSALANATAAKSAEALVRAARGSYRVERGAFDPSLFASWDRSSDDRLGASFLSGADTLKSDLSTLRGGLSLKLPIGTDITASLDLTKTESNSALAALVPEYDASGALRVRQPLLKGFGPSSSAPLRAANEEYAGARESYRDAIAALKTEVETTYWDLRASEQDLGVLYAIRDMAGALLQEAKYRSAAGLVGPNQVANARVFLAQQVQAAIDGEERLDQVSDQLATLMGRRPDAAARYSAASDPPADFASPPEEEALARANESSPELQAAERRLRAAEVRARGARWDALPALDLTGSLGGNGLTGRAHDIVFGGDTLRTTIDGGGSDAISQALGRDFPSWSVGLSLSFPLGLRSERGDRERVEAERSRAEQSYVATRRSLEERVRAACREVAHGRLRLDAAREGVD